MQENFRKHIDYTVTINNNQRLWACVCWGKKSQADLIKTMAFLQKIRQSSCILEHLDQLMGNFDQLMTSLN